MGNTDEMDTKNTEQETISDAEITDLAKKHLFFNGRLRNEYTEIELENMILKIYAAYRNGYYKGSMSFREILDYELARR